jgi:hypothetical protein
MSDANQFPGTPQFKTAEYSGTPGADQCRFCKQPLSGSYYRVNASMACPSCAAQVQQRIPKDNHAAFTRALLFGAGGAIVGLILYSVVGIVTGFTIGYVSLAVGWLVGKAMHMGSGGIGGRRYQIAAVILTYAAVSIAAVPIYIAQASKHHRSARNEQSQSMRDPADPSSATNAPDAGQNTAGRRHHASLGEALFMMILLGLASPILELQSPVSGLIGLVILFVGMRFAWQMTRGVSVKIQGPFKVASPPTTLTAATG